MLRAQAKETKCFHDHTYLTRWKTAIAKTKAIIWMFTEAAEECGEHNIKVLVELTNPDHVHQMAECDDNDGCPAKFRQAVGQGRHGDIH